VGGWVGGMVCVRACVRVRAQELFGFDNWNCEVRSLNVDFVRACCVAPRMRVPRVTLCVCVVFRLGRTSLGDMSVA
jgi:recombination DNA repair RAD52 pathway protein